MANLGPTELADWTAAPQPSRGWWGCSIYLLEGQYVFVKPPRWARAVQVNINADRNRGVIVVPGARTIDTEQVVGTTVAVSFQDIYLMTALTGLVLPWEAGVNVGLWNGNPDDPLTFGCCFWASPGRGPECLPG